MLVFQRAILLLYLFSLVISKGVDCTTNVGVSVLSDPCVDGLVCEESCSVFFPGCNKLRQFVIDDISRNYPYVFQKVCSERYFQNGGFGDRMRNPVDRLMLTEARNSRPNLPRAYMTEYASLKYCTGGKKIENPREYCLPAFLSNFLRKLYVVEGLCKQKGIRDIRQLEQEVIKAGYEFYEQFSTRHKIILNDGDLVDYHRRIETVSKQFAVLRASGNNDFCKCSQFGSFVKLRPHEDRQFVQAYPSFEERMKNSCRELCDPKPKPAKQTPKSPPKETKQAPMIQTPSNAVQPQPTSFIKARGAPPIVNPPSDVVSRIPLTESSPNSRSRGNFRLYGNRVEPNRQIKGRSHQWNSPSPNRAQHFSPSTHVVKQNPNNFKPAPFVAHRPTPSYVPPPPSPSYVPSPRPIHQYHPPPQIPKKQRNRRSLESLEYSESDD